MRAILIDPIAETITEVEHNGDYRQIYEYLSDKEHGLEVDDFNSVQIDDRNILWVDGEGLLKDPKYFICWRGYGQPLAGRGLILGNNHEGETVATTWTIEQVRRSVWFRRYKVEGFITEEGKQRHPMFGDEEVNFIRQTPIFGPPENDNE